jgi:hypothetical protein
MCVQVICNIDMIAVHKNDTKSYSQNMNNDATAETYYAESCEQLLYDVIYKRTDMFQSNDPGFKENGTSYLSS